MTVSTSSVVVSWKGIRAWPTVLRMTFIISSYFIFLKSSPVVRPVCAQEGALKLSQTWSVNQPTLLLSGKSMITLLVQPCAVTTSFSSTATHSHSFIFLMCGLFSSRGESPLRIGCKVSVMVNQSSVVLDNTTRWKWVKEAGNHQDAPCVNWRRSWFMAPGYRAHTCWIYSFFFSGSRTGKGAFLHSSSPTPCRLWHFVMDSPENGLFFKMNWAPSIGGRCDWVTVPLEWGQKPVIRSAFKTFALNYLL